MKRLLATLLMGVMSLPANAAFEETGAGARAPGLGDAFTALADDVYAVHYNPAGLSQLERPQFSASYSKLYLGLTDGSELGSSQMMYAHPLARGKRGVIGVGWERFSLSGLYTEQTMTVSYGRHVWSNDEGAGLMTGIGLKYLAHSFSAPGEASNSCNNGQCGYGADPVLTGPNTKSVPDADLGLIYRFPRRFQAGLAIQHFMEPNVGFGGTDKLKRAINMGLAYKSIWMSLIGELKMRPSAGGGSSRDLTFAAERYFPTLDYGQFGVRGALGFGLGGGDYRQMSMGASYRINKIAFDYAFLLPVGAIKGESGSHRVSLTYHFGAPTSDEEIGRDLLEHAKRLRDRGPDYGYEYSEELKPQDLNDPRLADVRRLIEERRYRLAKKALTTFAERQPLSQSLIRLSNRLELVAYYYQDLPAPKSKFDTSLVGALRRFFYSQDRLAMLQASYAYSQKPEDARLGKLLEDMEKAVGIKPTQLDPHSPRGFMDELLYQVEFAHTRGDMSRVETLLSDILELEPDNATALERLGSMRYLTGRLPEAIAAWESAVKIETRQHELESLREYLRLAKERASGKPLPGGASSTAPALIEVPATPTPIVPPVVTVPSPETQAAARPAPATKPTAGDVRDVEKLYLKGVEHYARGEYLQASAMFLRILQIDPNNAQARKALDRINQLRPKR